MLIIPADPTKETAVSNLCRAPTRNRSGHGGDVNSYSQFLQTFPLRSPHVGPAQGCGMQAHVGVNAPYMPLEDTWDGIILWALCRDTWDGIILWALSRDTWDVIILSCEHSVGIHGMVSSCEHSVGIHGMVSSCEHSVGIHWMKGYHPLGTL